MRFPSGFLDPKSFNVDWGCTNQLARFETAMCFIFVPFPLKVFCLDPGVAYAVDSVVIEGPCGVPFN